VVVEPVPVLEVVKLEAKQVVEPVVEAKPLPLLPLLPLDPLPTILLDHLLGLH
jgi:hypothetical protein